MRKARSPLVLVAFALIIIVSASGCDWPAAEKPRGAKEVRIGIARIVFATPLLIAVEKGFLRDAGLDVRVKEYQFGKPALEALLAGECDLATVADIPIVLNSFKRDDFLILATFTYNYDDSKLIARKDRGIAKPADLKGKKVGTTLGTTAQIFLSNFLIYHGLSDRDITQENLPQGDLPGALQSGNVAAIAVFQPYAYQALHLLGERAVRFPKTGIYRETFNLVASRDFAEKEPETLRRVLRGLDGATGFVGHNRAESIAIVATKLKLDTGYLDEIWDSYSFELVLDQSLIKAFEEEARWAIANKLTDKKEIPNYLRFVSPDALSSVKPDAVRIFR